MGWSIPPSPPPPKNRPLAGFCFWGRAAGGHAATGPAPSMRALVARMRIACSDVAQGLLGYRKWGRPPAVQSAHAFAHFFRNPHGHWSCGFFAFSSSIAAPASLPVRVAGLTPLGRRQQRSAWAGIFLPGNGFAQWHVHQGRPVPFSRSWS